MTDASLTGLLHSAGHDPWLQATAIIAGTFILEDAATIVTAVQVKAGAVSTQVGLASLYLGIVLGDLGVYGLGALAARVPWARRWVPRREPKRNWIAAHVFRVVFVSRFVPGARLPTYTACGFVGAPVWRFLLATLAATSIWTSGLFAASLQVGAALDAVLGPWRWVGVTVFVVVIVVIGRAVARMRKEAA